MTKGKRREKQAAELYQQAGYRTYRPQESKWGETDIFNLFDMLALGVEDTHLVQVKSNRAEGYHQWSDDVADLPANPTVMAYMLVCHDREGWRLLGQRDGEKHVWVDERGSGVGMGQGIVEWLQE